MLHVYHHPLLEMIYYRIAFEIFKEPVVFRESCYLSSFFLFPPHPPPHAPTPFRCLWCYLHRIIFYKEKEFLPTFTHESRIQSARLSRYKMRSTSFLALSRDAVIIDGVTYISCSSVWHSKLL